MRQDALMTKAGTPTRRGGPPVGLTREAILRAADTFEITELSMPRLAKVLGVSHGALYHWFPNKQALVHALVESTLQDVEIPDGAGLTWKEQVLAAAVALRNVLLARSTHLPHLAASASAAASPLSDRMLEALDGAGFSEADAMQLTELCSAWAVYSAWQSAYATSHGLHDGETLKRHLDQVGVPEGSRLRILVTRYSESTPEEVFEQNLTALLDRFAPSSPTHARRRQS
jgi:AcrR family transcriptional regulator